MNRGNTPRPKLIGTYIDINSTGIRFEKSLGYMIKKMISFEKVDGGSNKFQHKQSEIKHKKIRLCSSLKTCTTRV